jgi:AcrR family transcriptional regulator
MPTPRASRSATSVRKYEHRASPMAPEDRRAAIVEAVLPLLAARGTAVTSRELALAAGVAEGTIFKVFTDKDDLFRAALERATDPGPAEEAIRAIDAALPFEQRLVAAAAIVQRRLVDIWSLLSKFGASGIPAERRSLPDSDAMVELFAGASGHIRIPPVDAARRFRALVLAFSHPVLHDPPPTATELVDFFLRGVGDVG